MSVSQYLLNSLTGGDVRVFAKTNLGPFIPVYTGSDENAPPSLLERLGVKSGLVIVNRKGETLYTIGEPAATDPIRSLIFWLLVALVLSILLRGIFK